jgi:hypothetical protein
VLPPNPTLPSRTLEVLIWQTTAGRQFIALADLGSIQLGDAPIIRAPEGVEGSNGTLQTLTNVQRPVADQYTEARQTTARLVFSALSTNAPTGTLELGAGYACLAGRAACPVGAAAPADSVSCSLTIPFTAQEVPVTARWTRPSVPIAGAETYLVAIDPAPLMTLATPSCFRNNNLPAGRGSVTTMNGRALDLWQVTTTGSTRALNVMQQTFMLGDAPTITLDAELPEVSGSFLKTTSVQKPIADQYTEVRATRVTVPGFTGPEATTRLELQSQYACVKGLVDCPVGDASPQDAASCQVILSNVVAVKVP